MRLFLKIVATMLLIAFITGTIAVGVFAWYVTDYLDSDLDVNLDEMSLNLTSIVYYMDESGNPVEMERLHQTENRIWVDLEGIPTDLQNAFIAIEDERFLTHNGVDWWRTLGAVVNYVLPLGGSYGGSTITQQLIKNLTGENEVRPDRKIKEIIRAIELEEAYTKDQILEAYMNTIALGSGTNGVQAAAHKYFGKDVSELSLAESACIAGITNWPTRYNPLTQPEANKERQEIILNKMLELGMISAQECEDAKDETLVFVDSSDELEGVQSYFVDHLIEELIEDLQLQLGISRQTAEIAIYNGGLQIYCTIDPEIQGIMESVYMDPDSFPTLSGGIQPESAMVIMDPYNGDILGLVGGRGEKEDARGLNRATQSHRSPGSAIKPLSVYGPAIEHNVITYASAYDDTPYIMETSYPKNQNRRYQGTMTIRQAVEDSLNTVAVKVLADLTPQVSFDYLVDKIGFEENDSVISRKEVQGRIMTDIDIAPLALGGLTYGPTVLEMTAGYTPFINEGLFVEPRSYTLVLDHEGEVLIDQQAEHTVALSEQSAFITHTLLQSVVTSGTGTGARLSNGIPTAGKTGTTDEDHDRWFVGYSPYYVGAVWFGYDTPKTLPNLSPNPALYAWDLVMEQVHADLEYKDFAETPSGIVQASFCRDSGGIPTEWCSADLRGSRVQSGYFKSGTQPTEPCTHHVPVTLCSETLHLVGEFCPTEFHQTVGLVQLPGRDVPSNITVEDAGYVVMPYTDALTGEVKYVANPMAGSPGGAVHNITCELHLTEPEPTSPTDPETGEVLPGWEYPWWVLGPSEPDDSDDPSAPTSTTQPGEPSGPAEPLNPPTDPTTAPASASTAPVTTGPTTAATTAAPTEPTTTPGRPTGDPPPGAQ